MQHIDRIRKFFTYRKVEKLGKEGDRIVVSYNKSNISKILHDLGIFIPSHLEETVNNKIKKALQL